MAFNGSRLGKLVITGITNSGKLGKGNLGAKGNVILLHGTCDTGSGMKAWLDKISKTEFAFSNYRILYPSAPVQSYSLLDGQESSVWFDRFGIGPDMPEDKASLDKNASELSSFLEEESKRSGISLKKTVIGGFSSGGIMALHLAFRFHPEIAGVFALSSFLPPDSYVYDELNGRRKEAALTRNPQRQNEHQSKSITPTLDSLSTNCTTQDNERCYRPTLPQLFMSQGQKDPLVRYSWGKATHKKLRECGVQGHFFTIPNAKHEIVKSQLNLLHDWIRKTLDDSEPSQPKSSVKPHHINDECCIPAFE